MDLPAGFDTSYAHAVRSVVLATAPHAARRHTRATVVRLRRRPAPAAPPGPRGRAVRSDERGHRSHTQLGCDTQWQRSGGRVTMDRSRPNTNREQDPDMGDHLRDRFRGLLLDRPLVLVGQGVTNDWIRRGHRDERDVDARHATTDT